MIRSRRTVGVLLCTGLIMSACSGGGGNGDAGPSSSDPTTEATSGSAEDASESADASGSADVTGDGADSADGAAPAGPIDFGPLATPIPDVEPVAVFMTEGDEIEETEETLPAGDLLEVVERGVAAGSFSEAEGIARALTGLSGRGVPTPGLGPDDAVEPGLTALTRHAADLLRGEELSDGDRAMLEDALRPFTPSQELLDAISTPAPARAAGFANASFALSSPSSSSTSSSASSAPIEIIAQDCIDVMATGVSDDTDLDTGEACFYYVETEVGGHALRVYYSSTWQTDADKLAVVDVALDALATSTAVFGELATIGPVSAVFSLSGNGTVNAQQPYFDLADPCPITFFISALERPSAAFRQTVAHEVFHCVQNRSFTTRPYATHKWWMEGSATYFSNVVYPTANAEHAWTWRFDARSHDKNLTQMAYENTVFFQYYANVRGDAAIIDVLRTVSAAGATVDSIASTAGMERLWRDFVVAGVADAVYDTGGGTVGALQRYKPIINVDSVRSVEFETASMRANRYPVRYVKGKRYEQTTEESAHLAAAWANEVQDLTAWTEVPVDVRPTCERNRTYIVVATTVGAPLTPSANINTVEQAVCDPCLLGTWGLQLDTFAEYILSVVKSGGEEVPGLSLDIDGSYQFEFTANGGLSAVKNITVKPVVANLGGGPTTTLTGSESGRYDADGGKLTVTGWQGDSTASIGQTSRSVFSGPEAQASDYTCGDGVLTLTTLPYGPLVFDLLDPPPEPPPIIIDTGR